jgi:predicted transcriptional regulator
MAGRSTSEIATQLFISVNTVQDHLKSIFAKVPSAGAASWSPGSGRLTRTLIDSERRSGE